MNDPFASGVEALATRIETGASLLLAKGEGADTPMALVKAIIRRRVTGLHLVTLPACAQPVSGMMVDMLVGAGCVASIETSGVSMSELGAAPRFTAAVKAGSLRVLDATCPAIYAAVQAGGKGQPFAALRGLIGSDIERFRDDFKIIDNPFATGDPVVVLKAINPDVAMFHARCADRDGNVWIGRHRDLMYAAHAASTVLVTVDEIQDRDFFDDEQMAAGLIPSFHIDAIAEVPDGAYPMRADGTADLDAVRGYMRAARSDEGFRDWLAAHVPGTQRDAAE